MNKETQANLWYVAIALLAVIVAQNFLAATRSVLPLTYSKFEEYAQDGRIERVVVSDRVMSGQFREPVDNHTRFVVARVEPDLARTLSQYDVEIEGAVENTFLRDLLSWTIPIFIFFALWMLVFRKIAEKHGMGGFMSIGKSRAKIFVEKETGVNFDDVAGVDEAKYELKEIVDFLKNPDEYGRLGAHVPKGVLLVGPPGTGKTLLARAVAGEAGVTFFSISGSEFVEMFVGVGAARVRDLFEQAKAAAPAIIFIDELDALGRARGAMNISGHDEREQTLNQLLTELDGFDPNSGIVILAATNRPEILDPALLRAGRFDRQVLVDRPDKKGREAILRVHARKIRLGGDADLAEIAAMTPGFSGADLANLVNEAAILATRRRASEVSKDDFTAAIERIVAGLEKKNRILNEKERRIVAHHETGHAIMALALPGIDPVHKVSIIPRGIGALGYTMQRPTEDRFLMTKEELENKICVLLGGRIAEKLIFGHLSTGASDDLVKATDIARSMVERYAMDDELGNMAFESGQPNFLDQQRGREREISEITAQKIDKAIAEILARATERTMRILGQNREILEKAAATLLQQETLAENDIVELTKGLKKETITSACEPV